MDKLEMYWKKMFSEFLLIVRRRSKNEKIVIHCHYYYYDDDGISRIFVFSMCPCHGMVDDFFLYLFMFVMCLVCFIKISACSASY